MTTCSTGRRSGRVSANAYLGCGADRDALDERCRRRVDRARRRRVAVRGPAAACARVAADDWDRAAAARGRTPARVRRAADRWLLRRSRGPRRRRPRRARLSVRRRGGTGRSRCRSSRARAASSTRGRARNSCSTKCTIRAPTSTPDAVVDLSDVRFTRWRPIASRSRACGLTAARHAQGGGRVPRRVRRGRRDLVLRARVRRARRSRHRHRREAVAGVGRADRGSGVPPHRHRRGRPAGEAVVDATRPRCGCGWRGGRARKPLPSGSARR